MKLEQIHEAKTIKSQKQMIAQMTDMYKETKTYKKSGTFDARKAKIGEHIVTTIDGEDETKKTAKADEVVVKGPKGELYIVSEKKFNERYEVETPLTDKFQKYKANGLIMAFVYDGPTFNFKASWDEDMLCKKGDYLASPSATLPVPEVYRIEASVFAETYKEYGRVICGFPGVGKSTLVEQLKKSGTKVLDSDSSTFDKKHFPDNYIKHIKDSIEKGYTVFASSHDVVRDALIKNNMSFILAYPSGYLKDEYLKRYEKRGSPPAFIELLDKNFYKWTKECDNINNKLVTKILLKAKEFIGWNITK